MAVLMAYSSIVVTIFVYIMQRLWVKSWFRTVHSNTYLRKLRRMSSKTEGITGFYLLRASKRRGKYDRLVLYIININLLSIPLFIFVACLNAIGYLSEETRNLVFWVIGARDLFALLLQLIVMAIS